MIKKGKISSVALGNKKAKVFFPELNDGVTTDIPIADHVPQLYNQDLVAVAFFSPDFSDALIIARVPSEG